MTGPTRPLAQLPLRVALLALAWLALLAWLRPLAMPDEGRYVGVAWEMVRGGDWLVPRLNGLPYFHKPPLFYWITAAAMSAFGPNEWAARMAPWLGAWASAMAVFFFVRRWWGERAAGLALVVLLTQPLFYVGGQFANLDMLVAGCITVTIVLLAHAALLVEQGTPGRGALLGAYAAAALGVLAKGLIGAVLPALVIGTWLMVGRRWRTLLSLVSLPGAIVFVAIAAPWFIAMQERFTGFLDYFFVVQHFKRFASSGFNNVQPVWFYPALLLLVTFPWLPWLRPHFTRGRLSDPDRGRLRQLMWLWLVLIVAFFSLPQSKLVGYIFPVIPPLALLLADGIEAWGARWPASGRSWKLSAGITAVLGMCVVAVATVLTPHSTKDIGTVLRAQRGAGEPVYMLGNYYFDLSIYARLPTPVVVVLDWSDPEILRRDTWRKELADAGSFAPARAHDLLMDPSHLGASLCAQPVSWLIGPPGSEKAFPMLSAAQVSARSGEATLWRITSTQAQLTGVRACPETPRAG